MMPGMSTPNEPIIYSLNFSGGSLRMFTEDLSPQELLHRPTPKANCAAWLIGHLTLTDRSILKRLGVTDLPPLPDDQFEHRFSRDEGCPQAESFGDVSVLLKTFEASRAKLTEFARSLPPAAFDTPLEKPHPRFKTVGEILAFVSLHNAMHVGQITTIRRSLGKAPLM
jgi:uncharacterized damage-inducible protein DinB